MTERDDIAFGTPEAELLGAAAFDGEPPQPPADVKAALMARISSGDSGNARVGTELHATEIGGDPAASYSDGGIRAPGQSGVSHVSQGGKAMLSEVSSDEAGHRGAGRAESTPRGADDDVSRGADVVELPRRRVWVRRFAGAAAAVFLVVGGFAAGRAWTMRGMSDEAKFNTLNQASDYSQMSHKMADGHTIRLVWSYKEHSAALVMPAGMRIPRGKAVQAWSVKGKRMTSMGMYPSGSKARYAFLSAMPDEGESVMLTMEPASGSSAPSSDMVADIPMGKK